MDYYVTLAISRININHSLSDLLLPLNQFAESTAAEACQPNAEFREKTNKRKQQTMQRLQSAAFSFRKQ
jgi:hypothetical protein